MWIWPWSKSEPSRISCVKLHRNIFILTGKVQSGKSTWLRRLVDASDRMGIQVSGFICEGQFQDGQRSGFSLVSVSDGASHQLATIEKKAEWPRYGRFYFNPSALLAGETILKKAIQTKKGPVILDEVGPMELEGRGWSDIIGLLSREYELVQLWVVREQILGQVLETWNIPATQVFHVNSARVETLLKQIIGDE